MKNCTILKCRLCLGESKLLVMSDEIKKLIQDFLIPQIQHWPKLEHVCNTCVDYLKVFQKFKKKVLKVQEKLKATFPSSVNVSTLTSFEDETISTDRSKALVYNIDLPKIIRELDGNEIQAASPKNVRSSMCDSYSKTVKLVNPRLKSRQCTEPVSSDMVTIKKESREKEFLKCSLCDGSFKFAATLETHLRKRHAVLKCQSCNYSSNIRRNYVRHIRAHQNLTFTHKMCTICFTVCKSSVELFAHRKKVHGWTRCTLGPKNNECTVDPKENESSSAFTTKSKSKKKSKSSIRDQKPSSDRVQSETPQEDQSLKKKKKSKKESKHLIRDKKPNFDEVQSEMKSNGEQRQSSARPEIVPAVIVKNILIAGQPDNELPEKRKQKLSTERPQSNTSEGSKHQENQDQESRSKRSQSSTRQESVNEMNCEQDESWAAKESTPAQPFVVDSHSENMEVISQRNENTFTPQKSAYLVKNFWCPYFCGKTFAQFYFFRNHLHSSCPRREEYHNNRRFTCHICQFIFRDKSKYLEHVYDWHRKPMNYPERSNQSGNSTDRNKPQRRSYDTPTANERNELRTNHFSSGSISQNLSTEDSTPTDFSSKKRKFFDESFTSVFDGTQRFWKRKHQDSRSSNHQYYDENQSLLGNSNCAHPSASNSFENHTRYVGDFSADYNSRTSNPTTPNYRESRSSFVFRSQHEVHQRGYQKEQPSKNVRTEFTDGEHRRNGHSAEYPAWSSNKKTIGIDWKMKSLDKMKEKKTSNSSHFPQWVNENGFASPGPASHFSTIKCTLEKIDHIITNPPDVKPSLEMLDGSIATEGGSPNDDSKKSTLKYFCDICGKSEIHSKCWKCQKCFRSMSLFIDHKRKKH